MTEMMKLINLLVENDIPFQVIIQEELGTKQVFIPNYVKPMFDVVCNKYSYGGKDGLLEILFNEINRHIGCLTAEDVYDIVKYGAVK